MHLLNLCIVVIAFCSFFLRKRTNQIFLSRFGKVANDWKELSFCRERPFVSFRLLVVLIKSKLCDL